MFTRAFFKPRLWPFKETLVPDGKNSPHYISMYFYFIHLFLPVLGLSCCMLCRLFLRRNFLCSCGEQGLCLSCGAWASHCGGFCLLQSMGSIVVAHRLNCSAENGIFLNQGLNHVSFIGRQILCHWATREPQGILQKDNL